MPLLFLSKLNCLSRHISHGFHTKMKSLSFLLRTLRITVQHSTVQTVQYSTVQYNTVQDSTGQDMTTSAVQYRTLTVLRKRAVRKKAEIYKKIRTPGVGILKRI